MSRISTASMPDVDDGGLEEGEGKQAMMDSGIRKSRRKKNKSAKASSSKAASTKAGSQSGPQYLDEKEQNAIESWNDTVPKKSTRRQSVAPEERDPVIQAYLEAKMSLFRSAGVSG